jgi:hypothetical protein
MKLLISLAVLLSVNVMAADQIKCEARHEYVENGRLVIDANPLEVDSQLGKTLYSFDGEKAYYSINLDDKTGRYLIAINFAPNYTRGSLSSGVLEAGGNNLTLSVVDGHDVHKIFCLRN